MALAAAFAQIAIGMSDVVGGLYWPAVVVDQGGTLDDGGSLVPGSATERPCRVQIDSATEAMRAADGYADGDVRFLILAASLTGALNTDAEVSVADGPFAGRWMVSSIARDPATIGYVGRGRRA